MIFCFVDSVFKVVFGSMDMFRVFRFVGLFVYLCFVYLCLVYDEN